MFDPIFSYNEDIDTIMIDAKLKTTDAKLKTLKTTPLATAVCSVAAVSLLLPTLATLASSRALAIAVIEAEYTAALLTLNSDATAGVGSSQTQAIMAAVEPVED